MRALSPTFPSWGNEMEVTEPTLIFLIRLTIRKWDKACNEAIAACCAVSFATLY